MSLKTILAPLVTLVVVQVMKLATDGIKGNLNVKNLVNTYGGMPSSHTAFVTALTTMVGFEEGVQSTTFAICVIFSLVIISDALIFRKHVSHYGSALKKIVAKLNPADQKEFPSLNSRIGHTLPQVLAGAATGFVIALIVRIAF